MRPPYVHVAGDGPRVLLVQGTGIAGQAWAPQVEALRGELELAWYDAPGLGEREGSPGTMDEMVADAASILDDLGWDEAFVVGHSLGGVIALQLAMDHPARVRGLVLLCTFLRGRAALSMWPSTLWIQAKTSMGKASTRRRAFYDLVSHPDWPATEENLRAIEEVFGRPLQDLPTAATAQLRTLIRTDLTARADEVQCPAVVISGQHDRIASVKEGRRLARALGCPIEELDGGHALPIQQAEALNARIREILRGWA